MSLPGNKHVRFLLMLLYSLLAVFGIFLFFKYAFSWFLPFIVAFFLSRIIEPLVAFLVRRLKLPRPVASALCTLLIVSLFSMLLVLAVKRAIYELRVLSVVYPAILTSVSAAVEQFFIDLSALLPDNLNLPFSDVTAWWDSLSMPASLINDFLGRITSTAASLPQLLVSIIATLVATYFISSDYRTIGNFIARQMRSETMDKVRRLRAYWFQTFGRWIQAQLLLISITFTELAIGFILLGLQYAGVLAVSIALIDALPILGVGTILIPWALFSLFTGDYAMSASIFALYGVIALVRNVVEPKIVGQRIGLHPLVTLMCMYVGLRVMGLLGMFVLPFIVLTLNQLKEWDYFTVWK